MLNQIRRKMVEIMKNQASSCDLKELVAKFIPESIGREIEKATSSISPLQNVYIRKVKILKAPKFDLGKLMEVCSVPSISFAVSILFWCDHCLFHSSFFQLPMLLYLFWYMCFAKNTGSWWLLGRCWYEVGSASRGDNGRGRSWSSWRLELLNSLIMYCLDWKDLNWVSLLSYIARTS